MTRVKSGKKKVLVIIIKQNTTVSNIDYRNLTPKEIKYKKVRELRLYNDYIEPREWKIKFIFKNVGINVIEVFSLTH